MLENDIIQEILSGTRKRERPKITRYLNIIIHRTKMNGEILLLATDNRIAHIAHSETNLRSENN